MPESTRLGELDETIWRRIPESSVARVAEYVLQLVETRIQQRPLGLEARLPLFEPASTPTFDPNALDLSQRARKALAREGWLHATQRRLADVSFQDLLSLRGAGSRSVLEIATAFEHAAYREHTEVGVAPSGQQDKVLAIYGRETQLARQLAELEEQFPLDSISAKDPRLRGLSIPGLGARLGEVLKDAIIRSHSSPAGSVEIALNEVRTALTRLSEENLEESLARLASACVNRPHFPALMRRLGWDGGGGCTLDEAGRMSGVTRERIRQVENNIRRRCQNVSYFPQLDTALDLLIKASTDPVIDLASMLREQGLVTGVFDPHGVLTAADLCGRRDVIEALPKARGRVRQGLAYREPFRKCLADLKALSHVARVEEIQARLEEDHGLQLPLEAVRALLVGEGNVVWLDPDKSWFWHPAGLGGTRYLNYAWKVFAAVPKGVEVSLETLREGVFRPYRCGGQTLPREILAELLRSAGIEIEGGLVKVPANLPRRVLSASDLALVEILRRATGVAHLSQIRTAWAQTGFSLTTLGMALQSAPYIQRLAPAIYSLRGNPVDPTTVARLLTNKRLHGRFQKDHGWTAAGCIWIAYRVTQGLLMSGVVSVPPGVKKIVNSRRFRLIDIADLPVGVLVVSETGSAWGFSPFIRRRGVQEGDTLVLVLDLRSGVARLDVGGQPLLERYQQQQAFVIGEPSQPKSQEESEAH
ncbi:MAG TPA: hypothetical protein VHQ90_12615 [Thermoanaerobaculia bacterium]|nr:hypothetical protein [Thermoanaerobaculia bacterium]